MTAQIPPDPEMNPQVSNVRRRSGLNRGPSQALGALGSAFGGEQPASRRAHGANEGLHLGEFARVCLAEVLLLARLGGLGG